MLLPTSLVGSYPQPDWLIDRGRLARRFPPRVRARELWRVAPEFLEQAQRDATLLAIRAQEDAGLDIITLTARSAGRATPTVSRRRLTEWTSTTRNGAGPQRPPEPGAPRRRPDPAQATRSRCPDLQFLRAHTTRTVKITVPGPFTMSQQAQDDYYGSKEALAFGDAEAVNEEIRDLFAAGADMRPARRAVHAGHAGRGPRAYGLRGAEPGARRRDRARRAVRTSASATPRSSTSGRRGLLVPARSSAACAVEPGLDRDRAVAI